jgi:hypothetical protein
MSQHRLEAWTISTRDAIPRITESLEILDSTVKSGAQVLNDSQQGAESRIRGDLGELKNRMGAIEDLQRSLEGSTRASKTELVRWQTELQHSLESLCDCVRTYLDILLQQAEEKQQKKEGSAQSESTNALLPFQLIMSTVKFIGSSVTSGLIAAHSSAIFFLRKEEHRDHSPVLVVPRLATSYEDAWEAAFRGVEKADSRNDPQSSTKSSERIGVSTENTRTNQASISSPKQTGSEREPSRRPNVDGWWVCCYESCGRDVNPEACGHTCPDCAHSRCETCPSLVPDSSDGVSKVVDPASTREPGVERKQRSSRTLVRKGTIVRKGISSNGTIFQDILERLELF